MDTLVWEKLFAGTTNMHKLVTLWRLRTNKAAWEFLRNPTTCCYSLNQYLLNDLLPWRVK